MNKPSIYVRSLKSVMPLIRDKAVGFDIETTGLNQISDEIATIQFYLYEENVSYVCPVHTAQVQATEEDIKMLVETYPTLTLVGHHLQFDMSFMFSKYNVLPKSVMADTYLMARMLQEPRCGLKDLICKHYPELTNDVVHFDEVGILSHEGAPLTTIAYSLNDKVLVKYAGLDPFFAWILKDKFNQYKLIQKSNNIVDIESSFCIVSALWNQRGVRIDEEKFRNALATMEGQLHELFLKFYALAGREVKINSPKDLQKLLFQEMQLPVVLTTKTGNPATSDEALDALAGNEVVDVLRELKHLDSVYRSMATLPKHFDANGRVHPEIQQIGMDATARVYSKDPSLNQWPREARESVIPTEGKKFVYFDWSSAEPTILAHWAKCEQLMEVHRNKGDLHSFIASKVLKKDGITKEEREVSKVVNLAVSYGSEGMALVRSLHCSEETAREYIQNYFEAFPEIKNFITRMQEYAHGCGYTRTYLGRYRRLPDLMSMYPQDVKKAERQVINTAIQSSCADFFKMACSRALKYRDRGVEIAFGVFDSFLLEVPEDMSDAEIDEICSDMASVAPWKFNYKFATGYTWREVQEKC